MEHSGATMWRLPIGVWSSPFTLIDHTLLGGAIIALHQTTRRMCLYTLDAQSQGVWQISGCSTFRPRLGLSCHKRRHPPEAVRRSPMPTANSIESTASMARQNKEERLMSLTFPRARGVQSLMLQMGCRVQRPE